MCLLRWFPTHLDSGHFLGCFCLKGHPLVKLLCLPNTIKERHTELQFEMDNHQGDHPDPGDRTELCTTCSLCVCSSFPGREEGAPSYEASSPRDVVTDEKDYSHLSDGDSEAQRGLLSYLLRIMQFFVLFCFCLTAKLLTYWFHIAVLSSTLPRVCVVLPGEAFTRWISFDRHLWSQGCRKNEAAL